jgi:hypothetical protein
MYPERCKYETALFDVWGRYENLASALHSSARVAALYITCKEGDSYH